MDAPDFLVDLVGKDRAGLITQVIILGIILMLTVILVRWVTRLLIRLLLFITKRTKTHIDERLVQGLEPPLQFFILVGGAWYGLTQLNLSARTASVVDSVGSALVAISIFWAFFRAADVAGEALASYTANDPRVNSNLIRFGQQISKAIIVILAFVAVMNELGYNLNGVLAGLGLGGLAVALAAQEALSNLIGYFVIIADSPFTVGDNIATDSISGTVERIGFRSTQIRQIDEAIIIVPNAALVRGNIINSARLRRRRLDFELGVARNTPPAKVLEVVEAIRQMLLAHERVIKETVFVQFVNFGPHSLDIRVICYINEPRWEVFERIREQINLQIMHILVNRGVELPA